MKTLQASSWQAFLLAALSALVIAGCNSSEGANEPVAAIGGQEKAAPEKRADASQTPQIDKKASAEPTPELHPIVEIVTTEGKVMVKLNAEKAPQTVANFLESYVDRGFYEKTIVHYVEKDFIISAGGYTADGAAKETRAPIRNEAENGLKNERGTIAMARHPDYVHSATSQFFFNLVDNPALDHQGMEDEKYGYCVFGKVVEGLDVLDRIATVEVADQDGFPNRPVETVMIESVRRIR